jgi:hypothetical protein
VDVRQSTVTSQGQCGVHKRRGQARRAGAGPGAEAPG